MNINQYGNPKGLESMYVPSKDEKEVKKVKVKKKEYIEELSNLDVPEVDEP